jgi:hypothetical protein
MILDVVPAVILVKSGGARGQAIPQPSTSIHGGGNDALGTAAVVRGADWAVGAPLQVASEALLAEGRRLPSTRGGEMKDEERRGTQSRRQKVTTGGAATARCDGSSPVARAGTVNCECTGLQWENAIQTSVSTVHERISSTRDKGCSPTEHELRRGDR